MPQTFIETESLSTPSLALPRQTRATIGVSRPQVRGKFLFRGEEKLYVRGVTYGTFRPNADGTDYPDPQQVEADFALMAANGINAVRTYTAPPVWLLDAAFRHDLLVMMGLPWEQHITFLDEPGRADSIEAGIRAGVRGCAGHPALLCYSIGNEIPASIVRWHGRKHIENFLERLYRAAKEEDPGGLVTYVNFPSTEYLQLPFLDFVSFNVYLESRERLRAYLARLQNLTGNRPLLMAEIGLDSIRNGQDRQATVLDWQIRTAFAGGCAGIFVFSWTDEWHRGGFEIDDWDFGLTTRSRALKPALDSVNCAFHEVPFCADISWPKVSVVVCSYNGQRTIGETLNRLHGLNYPAFEVIVVDDGSTDRTADIARGFPEFRLISTENGGLSRARNVGMRAATGEIVAYIDDDAYPDPHWLHYLADAFLNTSYAAIGGPNLPPEGDGRIAECVANAPGGPIHVLLSDEVAEHIPGCNFSVRKSCLEAIGGFDATFRVAGDDVDVCWRLQQRGWTLGYHHSAVVWHHRRNSVRAYWKQQKGYGKAEALLEQKWPEKYNSAGHVTWAGRLYGTGVLPVIGRRSRVYHGTWGSALFQSLYDPAPGRLHWLSQMPEWLLIIAALSLISAAGIVWRPLAGAVALVALALGLLVWQSCAAARNAVFSTHPRSWADRSKLFALTALLFMTQPVARLLGRCGDGLRPWRRHIDALPGPVRPMCRTTWSKKWRAPEKWLESLENVLRSKRISVIRGGDFDEWDLEIRGGLLSASRLVLAVEEHGGGKQNLKWRYWPLPNRWGGVLMAILFLLSVLAGIDGEWIACVFLAAVGMTSVAWVLRDHALAQGAIAQALRNLPEETPE